VSVGLMAHRRRRQRRALRHAAAAAAAGPREPRQSIYRAIRADERGERP
jgi:hypothetical protein